MIFTVTLNPSLDYIMRVGGISEGAVNRSVGEKIVAGGKGINVSRVLARLGSDNVALGFTAGFTGAQIIRELDGVCATDFVELSEGNSRINVKLKGAAEPNIETDINADGPKITGRDFERLFAKFQGLRDGDALILAGSAPRSAGADIYARILEPLSDKKIFTIVDASGDLLASALARRPFLIKPNLAELEELCGSRFEDVEAIIKGAETARARGARNVLVSMDRRGALLVSERGIFIEPVEAVQAANTTGAGDALVAGFAAAYLKSGDFQVALKAGVETARSQLSAE